ncbi:MAG TPA: hypothetical protein VJJ55_00885 [Candidatus Paceibacterota bacterium]
MRTKSAVRKTRSGKELAHAAPEQSFWVCSGLVLGDLRALHDALLKRMDDATYRYHVAGRRNDFSKWVAEVLKDQTCAKALAKAKDRTTAARAVAVALKEYR